MRESNTIPWRLVMRTATRVSLAALASPVLDLGVRCCAQAEQVIKAGIAVCDRLDAVMDTAGP